MPERAAAAPSIRPARAGDAPALARLAVQLGYEVTASEITERLPALRDAPDAQLLVAEGRDGMPIGWLHVEMKRSLLSARAAQVMGLVVDEDHRSHGAGAELLERAESWAAERGCALMLVATRATRERAHRFYRRQGYELLKQSLFFEKPLRPPSNRDA